MCVTCVTHAVRVAWPAGEAGEDGYVFVDRDGRWFSAVLAYLRDGLLDMPPARGSPDPGTGGNTRVFFCVFLILTKFVFFL